jgi:uncharacterized membrane protein YedE/YeeE
MRSIILSLFAGLIFGSGLILAGMTQPAKVVGFLNLLGDWDPSLAFVMVGAIGVHFLAYRLVPRMQAPLWAPRFGIPTMTQLDARQLGGAALFGLGWGLGGYCPGPGYYLAGNGSDASFDFWRFDAGWNVASASN